MINFDVFKEFLQSKSLNHLNHLMYHLKVHMIPCSAETPCSSETPDFSVQLRPLV